MAKRIDGTFWDNTRTNTGAVYTEEAKEIEYGLQTGGIGLKDDEEEGGSSSGSAWTFVPEGSKLIVHCLAIKQLLVENGIDIDMTMESEDPKIVICAGFVEASRNLLTVMPNGIYLTVQPVSNVYFAGVLHSDEFFSDEQWQVTDDQSSYPTINEFLTASGDVEKTIQTSWDGAYINFMLRVYSESNEYSVWIDLSSKNLSDYFEIVTE